MNFQYFILISFLLLTPIEYIKHSGGKGIFGSCAPTYQTIRKSDAQKPYGYPTKSQCHGCTDEVQGPEPKDQTPLKITDTSTEEEKGMNGKKLKVKDDSCNEEMETFKDTAGKWPKNVSDKNKNQVGKPVERVVKVDFPKQEATASIKHTVPNRGTIMCANCEQCELQIKAHGDGVFVKCKGCQEVSSDEIIFPIGSNRKTIRLP